MSRRKLLVAAVALCMVAVLGGGTLAYFTGQGEVENTFRVATNDQSGDAFSIEVFETDLEGAETTTGITYESLQPADMVEKDPTVRNTGAYDAYVRLIVTISKADAWRTACEKFGISDLETIFGGYENDDWTRKDAPLTNEADNTLTYVYYLNTPLVPDGEKTLFKTFTVPSQFDTTEMEAINGFTINVRGEAIQAANTVENPTDTVEDAYEAFTLFDAQMNSATEP